MARARWPVARQAFLEAPPVTRRQLEPLDVSTRATLEAILAAPLFAGSLASRRWQLAMLPLDTLVVAQPMVNLTRVDALRPRIEKNALEAFFPMTTTLDVAPETSPGPTFSFVSSRGELTVFGAQVRREPENGAIEVVFRVEPRPNYVSALHDGGVFVLRNGYHRAVAAWRIGLRAIPCVIVEGSLEALSARMQNGVPIASLLSRRPPLLFDFADDGPMTLELELRPKQHALRLAAQHDVVYGGKP